MPSPALTAASAPQAVRTPASADAERALAPIYARGDRIMGVLVALHIAVAAALAPRFGTGRVSALVAVGAAGAFYATRALRPGSLATRCAAGLVLQAFCALHIYQMNGLAEMHFFFFTSVTAMILYQDWRALWPGVAAIIAQHTLFAVGHNTGWHPGGQTFFDAQHVAPLKLAFHFGIALAQAGIASMASLALRARTLADAAQRGRLEAANAVLAAQSAELEVRRAEAERANEAKSEFLATMSHELRTPLNAIAGYVELLDMELYGPLGGPQRDALGRVQRSQRHLLGLINDVLNFAKLEAGRVEYRVEVVCVAEVLADLAPMVEPQIAAKGLALAVEVPAGLTANADREKLAQVLLNLLSNAVKFTPPGGRIAVTGRATAAGVVVDVADTGVGIAADRLASVFEPFVQVDQRLTRPHEGTGLGLAISRELARGMGGDLVAESAPGAGSVFTVTLAPAQTAPVALPRGVRTPAGAAPGGAIAGAPGADEGERPTRPPAAVGV
jgi:signal transduction histidine kinase